MLAFAMFGVRDVWRSRCLAFAMFGVLSLQKSMRDRIDGILVSDMHYGICWAGMIKAMALLTFGLLYAKNLNLEKKGFAALAYVLCMFAAITVQKNVRDRLNLESRTKIE